MEISIERTLKGDLVRLKIDKKNEILAIVNTRRWFRKVVLLKAFGLNYDFAREEVLKAYRSKANKRQQA